MPRHRLPLHGLDTRIVRPTSFQTSFDVVVQVEPLIVARMARISARLDKYFWTLRFIDEFQWFLMALSVLPGQFRGDLRPLVADARVFYEDGPVFIFRPGLLRDGRVEVVVPSLPTLLADSTREMRRDGRPLLRSEFGH